MIPVQTTYFKPRSFIILLAVLPVLVFVFVANTMNRDNTLLIMSVLILVIPIGMFIFHMNSYVQVDNDGLVYKNPFRERTMQWKEVTRSYFKIRHTGKSSQRLWYFENITGKNVRFSTGLYSRKSLQAIAEALVTKCPSAEIDKKIRNIAEGKFPWYIF